MDGEAEGVSPSRDCKEFRRIRRETLRRRGKKGGGGVDDLTSVPASACDLLLSVLWIVYPDVCPPFRTSETKRKRKTRARLTPKIPENPSKTISPLLSVSIPNSRYPLLMEQGGYARCLLISGLKLGIGRVGRVSRAWDRPD